MMRALLLALLAFVPLARGTQEGPSADAVNAAIDKGVSFLVHSQQPDGSWRSGFFYFPGDAPGGETALVVAALVHSGLDINHQAVRRGLAFVRQTRPVKYYEACTRILMENAMGALADEDHIDSCVELLLDGAGSGYWDYPGDQWDLSNTQYALLGLWLAHQGGFKIKDKVFEKVLSVVSQYQLVDGGWAYFGPFKNAQPSMQQQDFRATASMTTAGMATVLFAYDRLAEKKSAAKKFKKTVDPVIDRGMSWLDRHMSYMKNTDLNEKPGGDWFYYYMYNIERLGTIADTDTLGGKKWYPTGAPELIKRQSDVGGWGEPNIDTVSTSFALLFLNRATNAIRTGGGDTHKSGFLMADDPEAVGVDLRIQPGVKCYGFIAQFSKEIRERYGVSGRFGLHIDEVKYFVDGVVYKKFDADVKKSSGNERFTCEFDLEPGWHEIQAVVVIAPAPGKGEEVGTERLDIRSPSFRLNVDWSATDAQELAMTEIGKSLAVSHPPEISVSSKKHFDNPNKAKGGVSNYIGERAVDGSLAYCWVAKKTDTEPWIRLTWGKGIKVQTIVLTGARELPRGGPMRWGAGEFSAPKRVMVKINGKESEHDLKDDVRQRIELAKVTSIKSLEIKILETYPMDSGFQGTGFAEIELLPKPKKSKKRKK
jgi:hypothetical protein